MFGFDNNKFGDNLVGNASKIGSSISKNDANANLSASTWVAIGAAVAAAAAVVMTVMENRKGEPEESVPEENGGTAAGTESGKPASEEKPADEKASAPVAEVINTVRFNGRSLF